MENHLEFFKSIVQNFDRTEISQMFGKPCGKINKKAFVAFFQDEMVFKIGKEEIHLLKDKYEGSQKWDPSGKGRPMKDWFQVPHLYKEDWPALAKTAIQFLESN